VGCLDDGWAFIGGGVPWACGRIKAEAINQAELDEIVRKRETMDSASSSQVHPYTSDAPVIGVACR